MFSALFHYFYHKRGDDLKKIEIKKRKQIETLIDKLLENDDEDDRISEEKQRSKDDDFQIDELTFNCTRHEGN